MPAQFRRDSTWLAEMDFYLKTGSHNGFKNNNKEDYVPLKQIQSLLDTNINLGNAAKQYA